MKEKNSDILKRYERQIWFAEWGRAGQRRLGRSRVAVVGVGALGSTLAQCLVRAGVGNCTIIDKDRVELSNLHRQFLYDEDDVRKGRKKAAAAGRRLRRANSLVNITAIAAELTATNVHHLLAGHHLVLDALDNLPTRFLVNEWCVKNNVPWIYTAVAGACGMTMVIIPGQTPCLRCLFPEPEACQAADTRSHGIINTAPAALAALAATEAFKLLLRSSSLLCHLRLFDLWTGQFHALPLQKNPSCPCCVQRKFEFLQETEKKVRRSGRK